MASNQTRKFNSGELTSNTIDRQFTPEFVSKTLVEIPARQKIFLDMGNRDNQPEHHGDKFTMEVRLPILNKDNLIEGGIDTNGADYLGNEWYAYDAAGTLINTYTADMYMAADPAKTFDIARGDAEAAAKAEVAALTPVGSVKSGAGSIRNGNNSFLVEKNGLTPIPETGGQMNEVNGYSYLVSAHVQSFGANSKYTVKSHKLDSRLNLLGRTIEDLGRYRIEAQEGQARASVIAKSLDNKVTSSLTDTSLRTLKPADAPLTYETFEMWEQVLADAEIPLQLNIISGAGKIDTKVVDGAYVVFCSRQALPTLRKLKPAGSTTSAWIPKSQYNYAGGKEAYDGLSGEIGALAGLPFRFVVVQDMPTYKGQGAQADTTDVGYASAYKTKGSDSNYYYDVFPFVVVGDDCYTTLSYDWNNVKSEHVKPTRSLAPGTDIYKTQGAIVTEWSHGFLVYRPERLQQLAAPLRKDGLTT